MKAFRLGEMLHYCLMLQREQWTLSLRTGHHMLGAVSEDDKHQLIDAWAAAIESYEHEASPVIRLEHRRQKLQF
jgi:hypothetical protein